MKKEFIYYCLLILICIQFSSCKQANNSSDSIIPNVAVNYRVNLNDNTYFNLKNDGGFVYIPNVGVKGIILYRNNSANYTAFERASPINPYGKCNIITMDASRLFLADTCGKATYDLQGNVYSGNTNAPLKKYYTELNDYVLQITNVNY